MATIRGRHPFDSESMTIMKGPVRYSQGRVHYTGRIDRAAFAAWCESSKGRAVLDEIVSHMRFGLFGTMRARKRVRRELIRAARSEAVVAGLQRELDAYLARLNMFVLARDLPRVGVDLYRLVVIPRLFANGATYRRISTALDRHPAFATQNGRQSLRDWFILTVIDGIEAAVMQARPSLKRWLPAGDGWIIVGVNDQFEWRVAFDGPAWPGHYYVLELERLPITRAFRKAATEGITRLEASLPSLSRLQRNEILREAAQSMEQRLARA
jgi:hypothetical protein